MSEPLRLRPVRAALREWLWPGRSSSVRHLEAARVACRLAGAALAVDAGAEGCRQIIGAIPLVVELSNDQKSWTEAARRQSAGRKTETTPPTNTPPQ